jgi:hypothetical protein
MARMKSISAFGRHCHRPGAHRNGITAGIADIHGSLHPALSPAAGRRPS